MAEYVARRLGYALLTLIGITVAVFALIHSVPGDPITYYLANSGRGIDPEVAAQIRKTHHLDEPLWSQYAIWASRVARLDFGESFVDRQPVIRRIARRLPNTVLLNGCALLVALVLAIPLGFLSALNAGRWFDRGSGLLLLLLYSLPAFWVALLLMEFFSVRLGVLPLFGMTSNDYSMLGPMDRLGDRAWHLVMPMAALAYGQLALFARFLRNAVLEASQQPFVMAARARGLSHGRAVVTHAGRNALVPLITLLGVSVPFLLSGSVIVETIFAWDGVGRLYYDSILSRDYPTIMGLTVVGAVATLLSYLLTDLLYPMVDPRVRAAWREK
jgi:peptide/nickel transport system permease protein